MKYSTAPLTSSDSLMYLSVHYSNTRKSINESDHRKEYDIYCCVMM